MNQLLSGEFGPRFVRYGEEPKPALWARWRWPLGLGFGSGLLSLLLIWLSR